MMAHRAGKWRNAQDSYVVEDSAPYEAVGRHTELAERAETAQQPETTQQMETAQQGDVAEFQLSQQQFGPLWKYVCQEEITNVDWDSGQLWVKYANRVRERVLDEEVTEEFIQRFSLLVANHESKPFNRMDYILSAETDRLRITFVHEAFAVSGRSMSIRKSLPRLRFTARQAIATGYCEEKVLHLLANCVRGGFNFVFCGEPGQGKTEAAKFFSSFIRPKDKVITIEDLRELHYHAIHPESDCIELKVSSQEAYERALAVALRLNPAWVMLAETRSREVRFLLESWSNGVNCMTTLHVDDALKIPDRILNMLETRQDADRLVNQIYADVGIGVLLQEQEQGDGRTSHRIWQVCFYYRKDGQNGHVMLVEDGRLMEERMPDFLRRKIQESCGQQDIYHSPQALRMLKEGA